MSVRAGCVLLLLALALAGCGKRGSPTAPGPHTAVTYPRSYPTY